MKSILKYLPSVILASLVGVDSAYLLRNNAFPHELYASDTTQKGKNGKNNGKSNDSSNGASSNGTSSNGTSSNGLPSYGKFVRCIATARKFVVQNAGANGEVKKKYYDVEVNVKAGVSAGWSDCYQYSCAVDSKGCYPTCHDHGWEVMAVSDPQRSGIDTGCNYSGGSYKN
jgi:hypothetical protein